MIEKSVSVSAFELLQNTDACRIWKRVFYDTKVQVTPNTPLHRLPLAWPGQSLPI